MTQIICLANSYKHDGRCIAGIDMNTGEWVRPIPKRKTAIYNERFIDGIIDNEPRLLDVLNIPIGSQAPDEGCQPENRYLENGCWKRQRRLSVHDVSQYVENTENLLHNKENKVDPDIFIQMPRQQWKSLQLIRVANPDFGLNPWQKKRCIFRYSGVRYELKVTDPVIINKINNKENISKNCLLIISMATSFKTPAYEKPYCWKMVAGVIELD